MKTEIEKLQRRISRLKLQKETYANYNPDKDNYHTGWSAGYLDGKLTILEDKLYDMKRTENENN